MDTSEEYKEKKEEEEGGLARVGIFDMIYPNRNGTISKVSCAA